MGYMFAALLILVALGMCGLVGLFAVMWVVCFGSVIWDEMNNPWSDGGF